MQLSISNLRNGRLIVEVGVGVVEGEGHPVSPKFVVLRASYTRGVRKVFLRSWVAGEVLVSPILIPALTREKVRPGLENTQPVRHVDNSPSRVPMKCTGLPCSQNPGLRCSMPSSSSVLPWPRSLRKGASTHKEASTARASGRRRVPARPKL